MKPDLRDYGPRVNYKIKTPEVRVISEDGKMLGIFPTKQAISMAQSRGLDLVEVNPKAVPPVCKVMDYGKFKYEKKKKEREARKHQTVVELKEVKVRPTTDKHDVEIKVRNIRRFLEEKNKVKLTLRFRGREIAHQDLGRNQLLRIAGMVADVGVVAQEPRSDGKVMVMILSPKEGASAAKQQAAEQPASVSRAGAERPATEG